MEPNHQKPEHLDRHHLGSLQVNSIWRTIQGEGPLAGTPAIFMRLAGCNIQCPACDTEYTKRKQMSTLDVVDAIARLALKKNDLVVITGGEPYRQNLYGSVSALIDLGYRVQIETNGLLYQALPYGNPRLMIVCSPKVGKPHPELSQYIDALKYVIKAGDVSPLDGLPTYTLGNHTPVGRPDENFHGEIYVQPLDEQDEELNAANMKETVTSAMMFGYRVCIQTHKLLGLP